MESSFFTANLASVDGGAIYGNGFTGVTIRGNTKFLNNLAGNLGDDIMVQNTEKTLSITDASFDNSLAKTSIYAEYVTLKLSKVTIKNVNGSSVQGAAIQCI